VSAIESAQTTIQIALGLACIQACEYREPKPAAEPGLRFDVMQVQNGGEVEMIRCTRQGANEFGACTAQRCPIAEELAPAIGEQLMRGAADRVGLPTGVIDFMKGVRALISKPGNLAGSTKD
jgi:hypothetical protein